MPRRYVILDVFTDRPLAGNPLAVVLDAEGLDTPAMQAIAREFNLSETVFVLPPDNPAHRARLRIFTPGMEMPFAGHPTVGTACLLASLDRPEREGVVLFGLEENIGTVPCAVTLKQGRLSASFAVPKLPAEQLFDRDPNAIAAALGLPASAIGFGGHRPSIFGAGVPFVYVPVRDRAALESITLDMAHWGRAFQGDVLAAAYAYCAEPEDRAASFRARMFSPGDGIPEDPATGAAAAALAGVIARFDRPPDGEHGHWIEQGYEMGRPSRIHLTTTFRDGALADVRIAGDAVIVAEGTLHL